MASVRPDNYAALLKAFAAQPKGRPNFALAARQASVNCRTAATIYRKGLCMTASRPALPPIEVALATLEAGQATGATVVPDTLSVLRQASTNLLVSSQPFASAIAAVAPTLEAKLAALPIKEAASIFTEFSRSLARVVDSTQKIRAIERAIVWEAGAPARALAAEKELAATEALHAARAAADAEEKARWGF
jgi:hypothetical protein